MNDPTMIVGSPRGVRVARRAVLLRKDFAQFRAIFCYPFEHACMHPCIYGS